MKLIDEKGAMLGQLDRLQLRVGRLEAEGWALGQTVRLALGESRHVAAARLTRLDVITSLGLDEAATPGFWADAPFHPATTSLIVERDGSRYIYALPQIRRRRWVAAQVTCAPGFVLAALASLPDILRWRLTRNAAAKARIKARLGLNDTPGGGGMLSESLRDPAPYPPAPADTRITVVLPIYNAFDLLPEVLDRLVRHTDLDWHLVAVEDCSTDEALRPWLRNWVAGQPAERVTLLENDTNLGFIRSVNRAFDVALARGDNVVLLNSDAFLPEGWASRLLGPILDDGTVASVTPMSNDAEIFTVPTICVRHDLAPGSADAIDAAAAGLGGDDLLAEAPTGVGFCMAMNIAALRAEPQLDVAFGRGYGEEVDWCQKTRAQGMRHLCHAGVFVEHRGGQSFGSGAKRKLIAENNARIARRYTRYDAEVQRFISTDPLRGARLALGLTWAKLRAAETGVQVPIYMTHNLSGGATLWLDRLIEEDIARQGAAVVLRVGGTERWSILLYTEDGITGGMTSDDDVMRHYFSLIPARRMIYSCGVGDGDAIGLPALLTELGTGEGQALEVLFHDFFPISPSYTLLGEDGQFHGVPERDTTDRAHQFRRPDGRWVTLQEWRDAWGGMLACAHVITTFSDDSCSHVATAYPAVADRIEVQPHALLHDVPRITPGDGWKGCPVIGVLGNIGYHKGAAVLRDLSQKLAETGTARLVVVGNVDPAYALSPPALIHGDYKLADLPALVARYGISRWLIPSIWPETFSYATHEALATDLPVWAFDIGSQGDAVRAAATGHVVPFTPGSDLVGAILTTLQESSLQASQHA